MATGRRAFGGDTVAEIHDGILHGAPTPVRQITEQAFSELEHARAVAKAVGTDHHEVVLQAREAPDPSASVWLLLMIVGPE